MILTDEKRIVRNKTCHIATLSTTNPRYTDERQCTTFLIHGIAIKYEIQHGLYLKIQFVPRSKHTVSTIKGTT